MYTGLEVDTLGYIIPDKGGGGNWYLLEFGWNKKGKWMLVDNEASLFINTNSGWREVQILPSNQAGRILGVLMAPNGQSITQTEKM